MYWKTPTEWGTVIHDYVVANGLTGSIMTFYELTEGNDGVGTGALAFKGLPEELLKRALETLVKRGKAVIFKGEAEGVKFL